MLIIPYVCAEFHDRKGNVIFRVTPAMRGTMVSNVPEAVKQDVLFNLLVADGSIKVPENEGQQKALEQDPLVGVTAEGKSETGKPVKTGKAAKAEPKVEAKAEDKPAGNEQKK